MENWQLPAAGAAADVGAAASASGEADGELENLQSPAAGAAADLVDESLLWKGTPSPEGEMEERK